MGHIDLAVKDVEAHKHFWTAIMGGTLVKKLEAQGIKMDSAPRVVANTKTKIAFLTDPWGTYIELTEGLAPAPVQSAAR